jgi:hypothetical protein
MNKFNDNSPKYRLLAILKLLIESPYQYTKKMLETKFNIGKDAITSDFEELKDAGFDVQYDKNIDMLLFRTSPWNIWKICCFLQKQRKKS